MPSRRAVLATCGSALLAGCTALRDEPAVTGSWPRFGYDSARTGNRDGDGPDPPLTTVWTHDGDTAYGSPNVSPVVADGRVYVARAEDRDSDERAVVIDAVDAETGDRRWSTTVTTSSARVRETLSYADSLAVVDETILIQTANGLFALGTDGTERWSFDNVGDGQLGPVPVHPGVDDGTVYTGYYRHGRMESEPVFYAIDLAEGTERWRDKLEEWDEHLVYPPAVHDSVVYVVVSGGGVKALETADGTELWSESLSVYGAPTVSDGSVFVGTDDDGSGVAALAADTGEVQWSREDDDPDSAVPVGIAIADDTVYYAARNRLVARDAETGTRVWTIDDDQSSTDDTHTYHGAPSIAGDRLYATGSSLFVIDRSAGEPLGRESFDGWFRSSPAVVDELVYVTPDAGRLDALTACETELFGRCLRYSNN